METGEAVVELACQAGGGAGQALVVLGRDDHRDFGRDLVLGGGRQRTRGEGPQRPQRQRQHPSAPLPRLRRPRRRPQHQHAGAAVEVGAELGGAGDDVAAIGYLAGEDGGDEGAGHLLALPLGRARALQLQRQQRRHHPRDRRVGRRFGPVAELADGGVRDPQLDRGHALAAGEQLLLLVGGGSGDREHGAGAVDQGDAGAQQAGRRAGDRRQACARLDRFGKRVEQGWIFRMGRDPGRLRARWHRGIIAALFAVQEFGDFGPVEDHDESDHDSAHDQRREHEERQEPGGGLLPEPAVGAERRAEDQRHENDQADQSGAAEEPVLVAYLRQGVKRHRCGFCRNP
jgi:hypothetical protein